KQVALANRVALLQQQFVAPVCALVLDDPVGVVQELNHARLDVVEALAKYRSIPDNLHQSTISDIILNIRDSIVKQTKGDPTIKDFGTPGASYASTRESQIAIKISQALSRLEKYYDEPARATFAQGYKNAIDGYQYKMTAIVKDLEAAYRAALWLTVIRQDYSPATSVISWAAQLNMLAGSLQGGMVGMNKNNSVWYDWMKDPDSPPFISLLGKEAGLISAVYNGSASYANLKTLLNSQEVCDFVDSLNFTTPVSSLTMSMNGAFSLVKNTLSEKANAGFVRTLQALAWVSEGEPAVTIFSGEITVREFQDIMLKQLDSQGRPVWSTLRQSGSYTQNTSHTGAWLQVTEPELLERKIPVRFASLLKDIESPASKQAARRAGSSAGALRKGSILKDGSRLADFPGLILAQDAVDNALMTGEMSMGLGDTLKIARQQYQLPRRVFSSSGLGFVLSAVMLGLQKSALDDNLNALQAAIPGDAQATMKLTSSVLMVTASAVEMIGFGHMVARWGTDPWNMKPNVIVRGAEIYAHPLIRVAGVIGGIASVVDGIALGIKAWDAKENGDLAAEALYAFSSGVTVLSGAFGIYAGFTADFALFGPIGICIGLAILGAVLATMAESEVRSPLEVWLSDTCFGIQGKRGKYDKVWNAKSLADLQEAINAYRTIASGVSAQLRRERLAEAVLNTAGTGLIAVQVKLPDCSKDGSDWLVELTAQGEYDSQLLARSASSAKKDSVKTQAQQHVDISPMGSMGMSTTLPANTAIKESWEKSGLLLEGEFALNMTRFTGAKVQVTYWPDKTHPDNSLQLTASV
ncbi:hypothetical protein AC791_03275, partial [Klebsiella sp. RIT-PI-d]|uniref:T6SS effector BTH_I2691 family protein n=1 Tax=Klebsiella sp. RIT-PI-d TaxID=1681196 RepID=UPI000675F852